MPATDRVCARPERGLLRERHSGDSFHGPRLRRASQTAVRIAAGFLVVISMIACSAGESREPSGGGSGPVLPTANSNGGSSGKSNSDSVASGGVTSATGGAGVTCAKSGLLHAMSEDPDSGAVDVSEHCLKQINGYRAKAGLTPYFLKSTAPDAVCCQADEAKTAALTGGHVNGGCGWQAQGFCGGGRNPNGTVQASVDWCPRLFFEEGPNGGHYQAMMEVKPRAVMCSFYAVSRDRHSVVVNYY
jgi:hypothetical protein